MANVSPLFRRGNPGGWGWHNPPCDGREARQHVGCDRLYFSGNWMKRRTWLARYNPKARAERNDTSAEYEAAWIRNRSIECEDCMAEEFGLHPGSGVGEQWAVSVGQP